MSNLLKSSYVVKRDEKRVIDSNDLIAVKLQKLSTEAEETPENVEDVRFEEFSEGLNAEQLEMLLEDNPQREYDENGEVVGEGYEEPEPEQNAISLEEINSQAEEILRSAQEEAERLTDEARQEASSIRDAAEKEGYDAGLKQGHEEAQKYIEEKTEELEEKEAARELEYDKKLEEMEPLLVDAITDIYEHIFHVSLSANREIMLNLLHDTVRNVEGGKNFIVHVSKNDFEYINDRKDQLTDGLGSTDTVEVIEDLTLRQSECFVEAEGGIYDCGIGTELELLKKELMLLSYQKG
ncbi:MAG: hypothetical protein K6E63_10030 [Lachnospiraceae bacterium]|nr:hypothetical protein [Lachnospiraceae bacterium]